MGSGTPLPTAQRLAAPVNVGRSKSAGGSAQAVTKSNQGVCVSVAVMVGVALRAG